MRISIRLMLADMLAPPGVAEIEVADGTTVEQALASYIESIGIHDPEGKIMASMLMVDKQPAQSDTVLHDGDELMVMRILGGG